MKHVWGREELYRDEVCSDINSDTATALVWTKKNKQLVITVSFKDEVGSRSPRIRNMYAINRTTMLNHN